MRRHNFPGLISIMFITGLVFLPVAARGLEPETEPQTQTPESSDAITIRIVKSAIDKCDQAFDPPVLTVPVGTTVTWVNDDVTTHTVVSGEGDDPCNMIHAPPNERVIDGTLFPRMTYQVTFDTPGVFVYTCHLPLHRMQGKIIVEP